MMMKLLRVRLSQIMASLKELKRSLPLALYLVDNGITFPVSLSQHLPDHNPRSNHSMFVTVKISMENKSMNLLE
jgi:hypothetical protein